MCFAKLERKFLNDKHYEVRNFYRLPKIRKPMIIKSVINTQNIEEQCSEEQNSKVIEIFKPNDVQLRPIVSDSKYPTRNLSQLTDMLLWSFLKRSKIFIRDRLDFLLNVQEILMKTLK